MVNFKVIIGVVIIIAFLAAGGGKLITPAREAGKKLVDDIKSKAGDIKGTAKEKKQVG